MYTIYANGIDDALSQGLSLMKQEGVIQESRNGKTIEVPHPVSTIFTRPERKVVFNPSRDANPFFHLMESLWILAGRQDVAFPAEFVKTIKDFSDDGKVFNAPYGYRLRHQFGFDQIEAVIEILKQDPDTRRAVCQMWTSDDLMKVTKDKACNMLAVFSIRAGALNLTVYNRSNDMLWGTYGANCVQFGMLLEYVAARLNVDIGRYTQVSNSFHVYLEGKGGELWERMVRDYDKDKLITLYPDQNRLVLMEHSDMEGFELDLKGLFFYYDKGGLIPMEHILGWNSRYFQDLVGPVLKTFIFFKQKRLIDALNETKLIKSLDWQRACKEWIMRRNVKDAR